VNVLNRPAQIAHPDGFDAQLTVCEISPPAAWWPGWYSAQAAKAGSGVSDQRTAAQRDETGRPPWWHV